MPSPRAGLAGRFFIGALACAAVPPAARADTLLTNGTFESFDYPGAVETSPAAYSHAGGLNNFGDIVNTYASGTPYGNLANHNVYGNVHGLLMSGGVFTSIDPPGAVETVATGINDSRQVVGVYTDMNGRWHGYLLSP